MPTLPNILPTLNVTAPDNGEAANNVFAVSAKPAKSDNAFGRLMTRALASASPETDSPESTLKPKPDSKKTEVAAVEISVENSPVEILISAKHGKADSQKTETKPSKKTHPAVKNNFSAPVEIKNAAGELMAAAPPLFAPVAPPVVELNSKAATEILSNNELLELPVSSTKTTAQKTVLPDAVEVSPSKNFQKQTQTNLPTPPLRPVENEKVMVETTQTPASEKTNVAGLKIADAPQATISQFVSTYNNHEESLVLTKNADKAVSDFSPAPAPASVATIKTPPETGGTSAANHEALMKFGEKTSKTAELAGKFLPGAAAPVSRENFLPVRAESAESNVMIAGRNDSTPVASAASAMDSVEISATSNARSQILERTQDLIVSHAARFSDAGMSSLQVVIKPEAGTQLSLDLRQRGDGVEAQAVLQQGDFSHLNRHWPELQQQLEQRGVRLASLTDGNGFGNGNHSFQRGQNRPAETDLFSGEAAGGIGLVKLPETVAVSNATRRGWESWA